MIYDNPKFYELAFSFRDIEAESAFMDRVIRTYSERPVRRLLEIAAGPAPHVGALAERGYAYVGLDKNPNMIAYATRKWETLPNPPQWLLADMASFTLPTPVDFVFVLLGSLYLNSPLALHTHFDSVAASLDRGGLYFLDLCLEFTDPLEGGSSRRAVTERDQVRLDSQFDIRLIDRACNLYEERWRLTVETPDSTRTINTVEQNMALFADDFRAFVDARPDFAFVGWWTDWNLESPIAPGQPLHRPFALVRRV